MITKEGNPALLIALALAFVIIGLFAYEQFYNPEIIEKEVIIGEEPEPVVEKPSPPGTQPRDITIYISRFEFDKPEVIIEQGMKVIWENTDTRRHMITNKRIGLFRDMRKSLEYGDSFEYQFNDPGTYEILEANFGINGKVIVREKEYDMITGYIVKNIEVKGLSFLLISLNLLVITALALVIGFHISRHSQKT